MRSYHECQGTVRVGGKLSAVLQIDTNKYWTAAQKDLVEVNAQQVPLKLQKSMTWAAA